MDCEKIKQIYINSCEEFIKCSKDIHDIKCSAIEETRNQNCLLAMEIYDKNCKGTKLIVKSGNEQDEK
jgi:hypothetical protein